MIVNTLAVSFVLLFSSFQYTINVTENGHSNGNCRMQATYTAVGTVGPYEAFSGGMNGDIGLQIFSDVQGSLNPLGSDKTVNQTISSLRELPSNANYQQTFVHAHTPYEIPAISTNRTGTTGDCDGHSEPSGDPVCPSGEETNLPPLPPKREVNECHSPLVIDLARNDFDFGGELDGVYFDINSDGALDHITWVVPNGDDAFLMLDLSNNGLVDDGSELFGTGTTIIQTGELASNGFLALAQYDDPILGGNDDGLISPLDEVWQNLSLWLDDNADGYCVPEEIQTLDDLNITWLDVIPRESRRRDAHGNFLKFWSHIYKDNYRTKMVDVFFRGIQ